MPNDRENMQITLSVNIGHTVETKVKGKDRERKITKHMITQPKSYGPFKTSVPKLNNDDVYKFMFYILMKNNFTVLSAQTITAIGCKIITHNKQFFKDHKMGALELDHFSSQNNVLSNPMVKILVYWIMFGINVVAKEDLKHTLMTS